MLWADPGDVDDHASSQSPQNTQVHEATFNSPSFIVTNPDVSGAADLSQTSQIKHILQALLTGCRLPQSYLHAAHHQFRLDTLLLRH